jgi:hypothetical protein
MVTATNPTITIFDLASGESLERPLTADEIADAEARQAEAQEREVEADAKVAARESALAKLAALGLTEEEVAAL